MLQLSDFDNHIDTISWHDLANLAGFTTDFVNYSPSGSISNGFILSEPFLFNSSNYINDPIIKIQLGFNYSNSSGTTNIKPVIYTVSSGNVTDISNYILYSSFSRGSVIYYIKFNYPLMTFGNYRIGIQIDGDSTYYLSSKPVQIIGSDDIEYWSLLSYFDQHKTNSSLLDHLNNILHGDSNSQNVQDQNDSTNNSASNVINQYNQLESNFNANFNDSMGLIDTSESIQIFSSFAAATKWFTDQLFELYNAHGNMKILFTLPLLMGIALFFIGRGNVVFRNGSDRNSNNHKYNKER